MATMIAMAMVMLMVVVPISGPHHHRRRYHRAGRQAEHREHCCNDRLHGRLLISSHDAIGRCAARGIWNELLQDVAALTKGNIAELAGSAALTQ
jgi:hypothetical protein